MTPERRGRQRKELEAGATGEGALLTDFYQLAMLQAYHDEGMSETAVFEFFVRRLPSERQFLLAVGLDQLLEYLETLAFSGPELEYLRKDGRLSREFIDSLESFRFTGDVHALPEGTVFFAGEPVVRVTAPIAQAQVVESRLINILHLQSLLASKAARFVLAAGGKTLIDFGLRRAHGAEAALFAARASYIAGFSGTATVLAGMRYGIPTFGTMAHSYIQAHDDELEAFSGFARSHPGNVTLLIDTYDIDEGARRAVALARELRTAGAIHAVRIDSGSMSESARRVRVILDQGGFPGISIFLSGSLDEHRVQRFVVEEVPADGFGIGTNLDVSADMPYLDCVYKLEEYAGRARRKRSAGKSTWPGRKQIYRSYGEDGQMVGDVVSLETDPQSGDPLLQLVMKDGIRIGTAPSIHAMRERAGLDLERLPAVQRRLHRGRAYPVSISDSVRDLAEEVDRQFR